MGLFDHTLEQTVKIQAETIKKQVTEIIDLNRELQRIYRELIHCIKQHKKPNPVKLSIIFSNNKNPSTMSLELKSGQTSIGTLVVTDTVTGLQVPATFTNLTATSDNEAVATVTPNSDGTVTATGVSAGTASASINAIAAFNDSNGAAASQALSAVESILVDAVTPPPNPVSLSVNWSTPA